MAKGDTYTVHVRGVDSPIVVTAEKAGRKLNESFEKDGNVQWFVIEEKTWTDKVVKTTRFSAADVLAVVSDLTDQPG